jgi:hypothetical protein
MGHGSGESASGCNIKNRPGNFNTQVLATAVIYLRSLPNDSEYLGTNGQRR